MDTSASAYFSVSFQEVALINISPHDAWTWPLSFSPSCSKSKNGMISLILTHMMTLLNTAPDCQQRFFTFFFHWLMLANNKVAKLEYTRCQSQRFLINFRRLFYTRSLINFHTYKYVVWNEKVESITHIKGFATLSQINISYYICSMIISLII